MSNPQRTTRQLQLSLAHDRTTRPGIERHPVLAESWDRPRWGSLPPGPSAV